MNRIHRSSSTRAIRLISLALCYVLVVTMVFVPLSPSALGAANGSNSSTSSTSNRFMKPAGMLGAPGRMLASLITFLQGGGPPSVPGPNLPDLAVARAVQPVEPVAPSPTPSDQACTDCTPCPTCGPGSINHAPAAQAGGPYYGTVGTPLVVSGLGSFDVDPGDDITAYAWTFGDSSGVFTGATPAHTYAAPGSYQISLTVTDSHNATAMTSTTASITAAPPSVPPSGTTQGNAALFIAQTVPTTMTAGLSYPVSVTMRNTGTTTWSAAHLYRLGAENPLDNSLWGMSRIHLPNTVPPGADVTFNFTVIAPYSGSEEPPPAQFQWRMVQEFVQWFDTATPSQTVTIISNYQPGNPGAMVDGPFSSLFASRIAVEHRLGQPGEDLLSGNYNWGLGLVDLAGRSGLNLNLGLTYNSMAAWTKVVPTVPPSGKLQATSYTFDADRGFPSAGFRLGFPTIQGPFSNTQTSGSSYLALMPSGGRVELRRVGTTNVYEAADSSYLQLIEGGNGSLLLRTTDGTQLAYWSINSEYRCTEVKDRNGNYLSIEYGPINGTTNLGRMTAVIDTLGRTLNFNYDSNYRLQSISQLRNGQTHLWATFGYTSLPISTNFINPSTGPAPVVLGLPSNHIVSVLTRVGLDDGSRYNFDYTSWGQVYRIRHLAADGHDLNSRSYNLPLDDSAPETDCPRFTQKQIAAENWNNNNAVTTSFQIDPGGSSGEVTTAAGTPDEVTYKEFFTTDYPDWRRGLVTRTEIITENPTTIRKTTVTDWTQDNIGVAYPLNPRPTAITTSDAEGNRRRTTIEYGAFGLPSEVYEQGPEGTNDWRTLRRTHTDYNLAEAYVNRRIIGLVAGQYLFAPDANGYSIQTLMNKVTMEYDASGEFLQNQGSPVQYDSVNYGAGLVAGRGNVTRVRRWDVNHETDIAHATDSTTGYNTTGSAIFGRDALGHQTTMSYADSFSTNGLDSTGGLPSTLAYPTTVTDADGFSSTAKFHYALGMATRRQDPKGAVQTTEYDPAGRVKRVTNVVNGAYTRFVYPASQTIVNKFTTIHEGEGEAYSATVVDGAGRVRALAGDLPNSIGHYSGQFTAYDEQGRTIQQTNPAEMNYQWQAAGEDNAGWFSSFQTYDWKGRPLVTTNQDGTTKKASYGGCGCAGGEVVTLTDEGTLVAGDLKKRQQKVYSDPLGRTFKAEVMNWDGTGEFGTGNNTVYSTTVSTYNARDQVTLTRQYQGTTTSSIYQDTTMTYDGYGRLKTQHAPAQKVDPGNAASTDHTSWEYNDDDTLHKVIDARGAAQTFGYNARHLVNAISYAAPSGSAIPVPAAVALDYDAAGNRLWMTDGLGRLDYVYDQQSRLTSEVRHFNGLEAAATAGNYQLTYEYNLSGELKKITDPFAAQVGYNFDAVGRVTSVTGAGFGNVSTYASGLKYRAGGQLSQMTLGNWIQPLSATYNARLQPTSFSALSINMSYQYYDDGRVKFSHDLWDQRFDRSYSYDQAGRMTKALSGAEARGEAATNNRPYKQDFAFDVFGNVTSRTGKHWSRSLQAFGGTYDNNRRDGWQYDADGRNTVSNSVTSTFDAAGRLIQTSGPQRRNNPPLVLTQGFDGDGQQIKKTEYGQEIYSLRSTALGGALVTEIFGTGPVQLFGQKQRGRVYVNGTELAHQSPITGEASYVPVDPSGVVNLSVTAGHLDPIGNDVGDEDPYLPETDPGFSYPHVGDINDQGGGCVSINGIPLNCSRPYGKGRLRRVADLFLPSLSRFRPRFDPRTPATFPGSQTTSGGIFRDVVTGSGLGNILYPAGGATPPFVPRGTLYANPQNPGRGNSESYTGDENSMARRAIDEALEALASRPDCQALLKTKLGGDPYETLKYMRDHAGFKRGPRGYRGDVAWTAWPAGKRSVVLLYDPFFERDVGGTTTQFLPDRIDADQSRALTILHEYAHSIWRTFHAGPLGGMTSDELDRKIFHDCFDNNRLPLPSGVTD